MMLTLVLPPRALLSPVLRTLPWVLAPLLSFSLWSAHSSSAHLFKLHRLLFCLPAHTRATVCMLAISSDASSHRPAEACDWLMSFSFLSSSCRLDRSECSLDSWYPCGSSVGGRRSVGGNEASERCRAVREHAAQRGLRQQHTRRSDARTGKQAATSLASLGGSRLQQRPARVPATSSRASRRACTHLFSHVCMHRPPPTAHRPPPTAHRPRRGVCRYSQVRSMRRPRAAA